MERDFMGLCSKQSLPLQNQEQPSKHSSGFTKVSEVKWPFLNKVSAQSYLTPFNVSEEDKAKITSSGFIEKSFKHEGQGGIHFSVNSYHVQHNVNRPHDAKMFSVSDQANSLSTGHSFLKNYFPSVGQNMNGANVNRPVARLAEPCVKPSARALPFTMFYAGTVNIFNDITPEKAKAIMLLAGNGLSAASDMAQPEVQAPSLKFASGDDCVPGSPPANIPPCPSISSPLYVSSHTGPQLGSGSSSTDEFLAAKTSRGPTHTTSASKVETPKVVNAPIMFPSAIPQARKASLARFLEKRKERVMSNAPYNLNKKSEDAPSLNSMAAYVSATTDMPSRKQL